MRIVGAIVLYLTSVAGFAPLRPAKSSSARKSAVITGPEGKAAASFEEDLMLTLQIIMDHQARSTTVSKDQFISQMKEIQSVAEEESFDVSIPYDAAAQLAYEASDKSMPYEDFKIKYEADAVALVKSKQPIDISIPYDAAARLAFEASDKIIPFADFKAKSEAEAVALVKSKQPIDLSVPYDAAARLAYEASDRSIPFTDFKSKYEADAVAQVIAKQKKE